MRRMQMMKQQLRKTNMSQERTGTVLTRINAMVRGKMRKAKSRGQTLVLFSMALPVVCGIMGLTVDCAYLYFTYTRMQTAADASAISGAYYLPGQPSKAIQTAKDYARSNEIQTNEIKSVN